MHLVKTNKRILWNPNHTYFEKHQSIDVFFCKLLNMHATKHAYNTQCNLQLRLDFVISIIRLSNKVGCIKFHYCVQFMIETLVYT